MAPFGHDSIQQKQAMQFFCCTRGYPDFSFTWIVFFGQFATHLPQAMHSRVKIFGRICQNMVESLKSGSGI
jgi:hypothetical protein